jgi:hypothetical protein
MGAQEALLMHRTAWLNCQDKPFQKPKPEDKLYVDKAVKMLSALACLNSVMFDLEEELVEHNLFRQGLKKAVKDAKRNVMEVYDFAFKIMRGANEGAARVYNEKYDIAYSKIQESVALPAPERSYNLTITLCRILKKLNEEVRGKYDLKPLERLYRIPEHIATDKIQTYNLNFIESVL